MGRVSAETIRRLNEFIDSLPEEARGKCALCNQTLTHIVMQAEAQIEAGTRAITRALAEKINETAAPQDRVTPESLRQRVLRVSGEREDSIGAVRTNSEPTPEQEPSPELSRKIAEAVAEQQQPHVAAISNGHFAISDDGDNVYPVRDPELRKREHEITLIIFPHLLDPIKALTTAPMGPGELYALLPRYTHHLLDRIDEAIAVLVDIKKAHTEAEK